MDIDVEHEGKKAKVTPTPPVSSGPPSGRSDDSSGGISKGAAGSPSSVGSTGDGAKVNKLDMPKKKKKKSNYIKHFSNQNCSINVWMSL